MTPGADAGTGASSNGQGGTVLAFLNEVAGGRKLLETVRDRVEHGVAEVAVVAPQNQPVAGQIVDRDELREAAQSRVEVTQAVLKEFGIDSAGSVMDPDSALALDDAIRAFSPREVLLSCLYGTRFGFTRKNLVEWAKQRFDVPITHIPVRIEDDAVRWDVTHTLVVATRTVASADLLQRLKSRAAEHPQRYTIVSPPSGDMSREMRRPRARRSRTQGARIAALFGRLRTKTGGDLGPSFPARCSWTGHYSGTIRPRAVPRIAPAITSEG